jgi:hypothetical protein
MGDGVNNSGWWIAVATVVAVVIAFIAFKFSRFVIPAIRALVAFDRLSSRAEELAKRSAETLGADSIVELASIARLLRLAGQNRVIRAITDYRDGDIQSLGKPVQMVFSLLSSEESGAVIRLFIKFNDAAKSDIGDIPRDTPLWFFKECLRTAIKLWEQTNRKPIGPIFQQARSFVLAGALVTGAGQKPLETNYPIGESVSAAVVPREAGHLEKVSDLAASTSSTVIDNAAEIEGPKVVRIPVSGYLRSIWTLFWSSLRHPLTATAIDLSTGRVVNEDIPDGETAHTDHLVEPSV